MARRHYDANLKIELLTYVLATNLQKPKRHNYHDALKWNTTGKNFLSWYANTYLIIAFTFK